MQYAATLGLGTLPAELISSAPPPPPGEPVPFFGYLTFTNPAQRTAFAEYLLGVHCPDGGALTVRLAWPPVAINRNRRCVWCTNPWPCGPTEWAQHVQATAAHGWAL